MCALERRHEYYKVVCVCWCSGHYNVQIQYVGVNLVVASDTEAPPTNQRVEFFVRVKDFFIS